MFKRLFMSITWVFLILSTFISLSYAQNGSLYHRFSRSEPVKVFVGEAVDLSLEKKADVLGLKKSLEEALAARKSITFEIVNSREEAELAIQPQIRSFQYLENDPVDMLGGLGMVAMDAAKNQHYARLEADIAITDLKSGQALWEDTLAATLTSDDITPENSPAQINARMAKLFIRQAFGKS